MQLLGLLGLCSARVQSRCLMPYCRQITKASNDEGANCPHVSIELNFVLRETKTMAGKRKLSAAYI